MALLETLVTTVGFSVAKGLLSVWLKDTPFAQSVSGDLVEIFKTRTGNLLAARKGSRYFEEIGDKVAIRLAPLFQSYEKQPETFGHKKIAVDAIAIEVANTIDSAKVTAKVMAKLNNDPSKLYAHFLAKQPDTIG